MNEEKSVIDMHDETNLLVSASKAMVISMMVHTEDEHPSLSSRSMNYMLWQVERNLETVNELVHGLWEAHKKSLQVAPTT